MSTAGERLVFLTGATGLSALDNFRALAPAGTTVYAALMTVRAEEASTTLVRKTAVAAPAVSTPTPVKGSKMSKLAYALTVSDELWIYSGISVSVSKQDQKNQIATTSDRAVAGMN